MEQNFQTSFIPKRPIVETTAKSSKPVGFFMILSIFVFIAVCVSYGGLYFYKEIIVKNIEQKKKDLKLAEGRFEIDTIKKYTNLDKKLIASKEVLGQHIALTPIFKELQKITMKTVRYTDFSYSFAGGKDNKIEVNLKGIGIGYRSIALQSDLFAKDKNFINPVFSGLSLDDKGNVSFDLIFTVDQAFVDFDQNIKIEDSTADNVISENDLVNNEDLSINLEETD